MDLRVHASKMRPLPKAVFAGAALLVTGAIVLWALGESVRPSLPLAAIGLAALLYWREKQRR